MTARPLCTRISRAKTGARSTCSCYSALAWWMASVVRGWVPAGCAMASSPELRRVVPQLSEPLLSPGAVLLLWYAVCCTRSGLTA